MRRLLISFGFLAAALAGCGDDKSLVVGEERGGAEGATGGLGTGGTAGTAGIGGTTETGGTAGAGSGGMAGAGGSSRGGTSGAGDAGDGPGPGPELDCMQMASDYRSFLRSAQVCDPMAPNPCSLERPDDLLCGCPTYVNPARYLDIPYMDYLLEAAKGCERSCPTIMCRPANGGACMVDMRLEPPRPHCFAVR